MRNNRYNNRSQGEEVSGQKSTAADAYSLDALALLIRDGCYTAAVDLFRKARVRSSQAWDPALSRLLDYAYGTCLALELLRSAFDSQDRVINQIKQREIELAGQLQRILSQTKERVEHGVLGSTAGRSAGPDLDREPSVTGSGPAPAGIGLKRLLHSILERNVLYRAEEAAVAATRQNTDQAAPFAVYCLGPFRVYHDGQAVVEWNGGKGLSIYKYLVANISKPTAKDILMDVFWPDADPEAARRNLHQGIYCLRETFRRLSPEVPYIHYKNDSYNISPDVVTWIDADEFEKHVWQGRRLETRGNCRDAMEEYVIAEELYQGEFMEEELYTDWPLMRRSHLRDLYFEIADLLAAFYIRQKNFFSAVTLSRKVLTYDPCSEEAHLRLMQSYLAQGQVQLAIRQFHTCVQALKKELHVPPSPEIRSMYDRIISAR